MSLDGRVAIPQLVLDAAMRLVGPTKNLFFRFEPDSEIAFRRAAPLVPDSPRAIRDDAVCVCPIFGHANGV